MGKILLAPDVNHYIKIIRSSHNMVKKPFEITGIRFDSNAMDNMFDDLLFFSNDKTVIVSYATTVPGKYWVQNPMDGVDGTAFIVPGAYEDSHILGIHLPSRPDIKHEAWVQCGNIKYAQDLNRDGIIEISEPIKERDEVGLNIHRANKMGITPYVNKWSAGCQVSQIAELHEAGILMHKESMNIKTPISYLLSTEKEWQDIIGVDDVKKYILGLVQ